MKHSTRALAPFLALGISVYISQLVAQTQSGSMRLLAAMAMNAKQVQQYEWKQRITVFRKGNPSEPVIDQIRFDSSGQMQRTTISAPPPKQMGGIRGKIAAGVKEDVKNIMELAGRYNKPQQIVEAVRKGQISKTGDALRVQSNDIIQPTDSMAMLVDPATHHATHIDFKTTYEGDPMTIAQDYSPIPDGPNMMKSMKVSVPEKGLAINIDSYDFVRQTAANGGLK